MGVGVRDVSMTRGCSVTEVEEYPRVLERRLAIGRLNKEAT